jgi:predicted dehydrogenase
MRLRPGTEFAMPGAREASPLAVSEKRCAVIGFGRAGEAYVAAISDMPELALSGVVESDLESRRRAAHRGLPVFRSVDALLASAGSPHVAALCTPPAIHPALCTHLLRAGVDLIVEGPLATSPEDADGIAAQAERLNRLLFGAARFRRSPAVLEVRRLLEEGCIGRLHTLEVTLAHERNARRGWRSDPAISGGGVWMDFGIDALDLVETLAGPIDRLRIVLELREQGAGVEDELVAETAHAHGVRARLHLTWNRQLIAPIARCIGTRGELLLGRTGTLVRGDGGQKALAAAYDARIAIRAALDEFLRTRVCCSFDDRSALAISWIHAGYRSLASNRWEIA